MRPSLRLPPPITSEIPGTWAYSTTTQRIGEIARRTLKENSFRPQIVARVEALIAAIPDEPVRYLGDTAPDAAGWEAATTPYLGQNWLTPPWFFIETYFYRRLIEATGYYEQGPGQGHDPFHYQKRQGLLTAVPTIEMMAVLLADWLAGGHSDDHIAALLALDLWGNRADLSLWPADEEGAQPADVNWEAASSFTLANDTDLVIRYLNGRPQARIDMLVDNAGLELVADLILADFLLSSRLASHIKLHLKLHPTFVSDATVADVVATAAFLSANKQPDVQAFGKRLEAHIAAGRLALTDPPFWVSPHAFWELPKSLRHDLQQADLIISKGDANYRRLLGDRLWPYTTPFTAIMSYTPAPIVALRGLKAELACGLTEEQIARLDRDDPDWLVNGRWGVIQFAQPASVESQAA